MMTCSGHKISHYIRYIVGLTTTPAFVCMYFALLFSSFGKGHQVFSNLTHCRSNSRHVTFLFLLPCTLTPQTKRAGSTKLML